MIWMKFTKILNTIQINDPKYLSYLMKWFVTCLLKKKFYQNYLSAKILVFISQSSFDVSKINRLNSTHYFIMKNQTELQQNVIDHSSDIDFKDFL